MPKTWKTRATSYPHHCFENKRKISRPKKEWAGRDLRRQAGLEGAKTVSFEETHSVDRAFLS